jgi:hypothetical protein
VQAQRFADLPRHRVQRVQRRHRLLEDHAEAGAAQATPVALGQGRQLAPSKRIEPCSLRAIGQQPHQRQRGHRLAAAGLADQAQGLPARRA